MDFLTDEVIAEIGISKEQVEKIKPLYENNIADLKKDWDGKANTDAEKILDGAIAKIVEVTKVPRAQGEKVAEYLERASTAHFATLETDLKNAKAEYDKKVKDFKGDEATKAELDKAKDELDKAKQKLANYDELVDKAGKYESTAEALSGMKLSVAYNSVKPNFPDTVDEYRVKAKWDEFIKATNEKWLIEIVDNEPIAIDKDNEHKRVKLSELVSQNKEITELLQGRQQSGSGAKPAKTKVDGLPFEIDGEPTSANLSKAINTYLDSQGVPKVSDERGKKFQELFNKAKELLKK